MICSFSAGELDTLSPLFHDRKTQSGLGSKTPTTAIDLEPQIQEQDLNHQWQGTRK